jgi:hypothetical protein
MLPEYPFRGAVRGTFAGRWTPDGGRWTVDGGRWTVDGGRWTPEQRDRILRDAADVLIRHRLESGGLSVSETERRTEETARLRLAA